MSQRQHHQDRQRGGVGGRGGSSFSMCLTAMVVTSVLMGTATLARAAEINAQSGSRDHIQDAVNAAQVGDTVTIPAGTFAFSGKVTIDKAITVIGAGPTQTYLNSTNDPGTEMFRVNSSHVTIRDISFAGMPQGSGAIRDVGIQLSNSQDFVIHNCHVKDFGTAGISCGGADCKGVISQCRFVDIFRPEINNLGYGVNVVGSEDVNWNRPLDLGSDRFVFVEDSYFTGTRHAISSSKGSRYVFRYNETHDPRPDNGQHIDTHGVEYGSDRGSRAFEIYGNFVDDTGGVASWAGITIRAGDGIIADNTFMPKVNNRIYLCNRLDGSSTCDYPNLDQTTQMYVWNNTYDGAPIGVTVKSGHECLFQLDRDYFYHAPPGYVPYPYPHPLLAGILPADAGAGDAAVPTDASATDASASDAPVDASATDAAPTTDASPTDAGAKDTAPPVDADAGDAPLVPGNAAPAEEDGGCDCSVAHSPNGRVPAYLGVVLAVLAAGRRRQSLASRRAALSLES